jgi:hypothetical protein
VGFLGKAIQGRQRELFGARVEMESDSRNLAALQASPPFFHFHFGDGGSSRTRNWIGLLLPFPRGKRVRKKEKTARSASGPAGRWVKAVVTAQLGYTEGLGCCSRSSSYTHIRQPSGILGLLGRQVACLVSEC